MRIISGNHKGKKIQAPKSLPVRPTTDRAKESVFNILENRYNLSEKKILDLFSGDYKGKKLPFTKLSLPPKSKVYVPVF
jgi:purine-nucleoside phosphorylase